MAREAPLEHLSAVSVCVNYPQYLELCAQNRPHFDRWLVVTTAEDERTRAVCRRHDLEPVLSRRLRENGDAFNKGKALNDGLDALGSCDWILLIDADILLPDNFREVLEHSALDRESIYTCRYRALCPDLAAYERMRAKVEAYTSRRRETALSRLIKRALGRRFHERLMTGPVPRVYETHPVLTDSEILAEIERRSRHCVKYGPIDSRWRDPSLTDQEIAGLKRDWLLRHAGRDCLEQNDFKAGFIQLFHGSSGRRYSEAYGTAGTSDMLFFQQFSETVDESPVYAGKVTRFTHRKWKHLLVPSPLKGCNQGYLMCYHLGPIYENWEGIDPDPDVTPTP